MMNIDTSYLYLPDQEGWGYMNVYDLKVIDAFQCIQDIVEPQKVIEIGMYAGHSTLLMMSVFQSLKSIVSYDPGKVSAKSSQEIAKRYPLFSFHNKPIWGDEDQHLDIDLMFVDGDHQTRPVLKDIESVFTILPRFALFDNVEHSGVSAALTKAGLYNVKYNPTYFFYSNVFKGNHKPGILMLIDLQNLSDIDILEVLKKITDE